MYTLGSSDCDGGVEFLQPIYVLNDNQFNIFLVGDIKTACKFFKARQR